MNVHAAIEGSRRGLIERAIEIDSAMVCNTTKFTRLAIRWLWKEAMR